MKKKDRIEKFISPFSGEEIIFILSDELTRDEEKILNCEANRRRVEKANESIRNLDPESRAFLRSLVNRK